VIDGLRPLPWVSSSRRDGYPKHEECKLCVICNFWICFVVVTFRHYKICSMLLFGCAYSVRVPLDVAQSSKHRGCTYGYFLVMSNIFWKVTYRCRTKRIRQFIIPRDEHKNVFLLIPFFHSLFPWPNGTTEHPVYPFVQSNRTRHWMERGMNGYKRCESESVHIRRQGWRVW
jgi:hypothetical protein